MKILIVEDSKTLQRVMEGHIRSAGHTPLLAPNGETAVQIIERERIDMVIMDVEMPGLDGFETTRLIRENLGDAWIPILFVTGQQGDDYFAQGIDAGGDDYITKPVSAVMLKAKIRAMERIAAMRKQLADLNAELTHLSQHDSLTGLYNRRIFEQLAEKAWQHTTRTGEPLSLLLLDIDHFKAYNDYYGHVEGDECIRKVADALNQSFNRPNDVVARYGGEEFICLLPGTDLQGAQHIAEHLRRRVRELYIEHRASSTDTYVTVSVGGNVVRYTTGINLGDQITLADKALYDSKRRGRNCHTVTEFEDLYSLLLIDNETSNASQLCEYLSGHCKLTHFSSLEASASFSNPDLILLNGDCKDLLQDYRLFADKFNLNLTPLLLVSSKSDAFDQDEHEQLRNAEVVLKPINKHQLLSKINQVLGT